MFKKVLVANRGEIAVRVIRACKEMGITAVAVYSDVDRNALHVRYADEAYLIGAAPARDSYLRAGVILDVAQRCHAEAVHPGYGFLAENADFAQAVSDAGLVFIGPTAAAMRAMGDKIAARRTAAATGVPIVPGMLKGVVDLGDAREAAATIGYPVLIKAAAGGGGKGMREVHDAEQLAGALRASASEARASFGDDRLYIEKLIEDARHIEFQLLADSAGNVVHLGERECSIQRRPWTMTCASAWATPPSR
jgi:acetyl-CoA carboxylase biotin carboxylase subunit